MAKIKLLKTIFIWCFCIVSIKIFIFLGCTFFNVVVYTSLTNLIFDLGPNGDVTYSINRRQSDNQELFAIDTLSGLLTVNKRLDFESKDQHELVVVAKDNGDVPQETTAFITVKITDINDNQPKINAVYRTPTGRPELREDALIGQKIADITVTDPDEPTQIADFDVTLSGSEAGYFSLERQRSGYSLVLARLENYYF